MEIVELTPKEITYFNLVKFWQNQGNLDQALYSAQVMFDSMWRYEWRQERWKRACGLLGIEIDTLPA